MAGVLLRASRLRDGASQMRGVAPSRCELTHSLRLQRPPEVRLRAGVHALGDDGRRCWHSRTSTARRQLTAW